MFFSCQSCLYVSPFLFSVFLSSSTYAVYYLLYGVHFVLCYLPVKLRKNLTISMALGRKTKMRTNGVTKGLKISLSR